MSMPRCARVRTLTATRLAAVAVLGTCSVLSQSPERSHDGSTYRRQSVLVDSSSTLASLRKEALRVREASREQFPVLQLRFCSDLALCDRVIKPSHFGYEGVVLFAEAERRARTGHLFAEVMFIGTDGVLRARMPNGAVVRETIGGRDPLLFSFDDLTLELCWLDFWTPMGVSAETGQDEEAALFAITSSPIDRDKLRHALSTIQSRLGLRYLHLAVGRQPWFPFSDRFPFLFPFSLEHRMPTAAETAALPSAECTLGLSGSTCTVFREFR